MIYFSIIIPAYNAEKYIELCLDSISKQSFNDYELIIINDGSTDHTFNICNRFRLNANIKQFVPIRFVNKTDSVAIYNYLFALEHFLVFQIAKYYFYTPDKHYCK